MYNRRAIIRGLLVAPIAAAAAPLAAPQLVTAVLRLVDKFSPALRATHDLLDRIAAGVGIPRHILTNDHEPVEVSFRREWITTIDPLLDLPIDGALARRAGELVAKDIDRQLMRGLGIEADRIMQASKLMTPALPPAHPMCRCTILPEGAYVNVHEVAVTVHGGTDELPTIHTEVRTLDRRQAIERDVQEMLESLERSEIHGSYAMSGFDRRTSEELDAEHARPERADQYLERLTAPYVEVLEEAGAAVECEIEDLLEALRGPADG